MLLGQLTLDVGRFRDVLKVAPRAPRSPPRRDTGERRAHRDRLPQRETSRSIRSPRPASVERVRASGRPAQSRRAQIAASDSASGVPGSGAKRVLPAHLGRQRHQDRFDAPVGAQAEHGAAVVEQVELDVAAAAQRAASGARARPRGRRAAARRSAGRRRGWRRPRRARRRTSPRRRPRAATAASARRLPGGRLGARAQVVEEDAAHAARLVAVRQEEVVVAPALEARVEARRRGARSASRSVRWKCAASSGTT